MRLLRPLRDIVVADRGSRQRAAEQFVAALLCIFLSALHEQWSITLPHIPHLRYLELAESEREAGEFLENNLVQLEQYRHHFETDLALYDFGHSTRFDEEGWAVPTRLGWMLVAARDGAMMLYHFGMILRNFPGLLKQSPTIGKLVDGPLLQEARDFFETYFEHFYAVRQGVAHLADHSKTAERMKKHASSDPSELVTFVGDPAPYYLRNSMTGRKWWATVEGKVVWYELSQQSSDALTKAQEMTYRSFVSAADELLRRAIERKQTP